VRHGLGGAGSCFAATDRRKRDLPVLAPQGELLRENERIIESGIERLGGQGVHGEYAGSRQCQAEHPAACFQERSLPAPRARCEFS